MAATATATASAAGLAAARVELSLSCKQLINMDIMSKSDPMVVVYSMVHTNWHEVGRTEMIKDNLNPKFVKKVILDYFFEEVQPMKFQVFDIDDARMDLKKADFIGEATCNLSDILTHKGQSLQLKLTNSRVDTSSNRGYIVIDAEEMKEVNYQVKFKLSASHLDKKDLFGKSDPFVVVHRAREPGKWVPVSKTEVIKKTLDPSWNEFQVAVQQLNNGDFTRELMFEIWDWNKSGNNSYIGNVITSLDAILKGAKAFNVMNDAKKKKHRSYQNSGTLLIEKCELIKVNTFLEYIAGGCEISLMVAVDFTASNGNPLYANSLHYQNPYQPNDYVQAIRAVGDVLANYDSDRFFPAFGFGAKIPPRAMLSHCFPLNLNPQAPEVAGVDGILQAYGAILPRLELYGPTCFAEILKVAQGYAQQGLAEDFQKYFILLIITDGVINDMDATVDAIVASTQLPLSIVIVGVGSADFSNMEVLDADDAPLRSSRGVVAQRDIVQFVSFKNVKANPAILAKEVLAEIPHQLVSFYASKKMAPRPPGTGIHTGPYKGPIPRANTMAMFPSAAAATGPVVPPQGGGVLPPMGQPVPGQPMSHVQRAGSVMPPVGGQYPPQAQGQATFYGAPVVPGQQLPPGQPQQFPAAAMYGGAMLGGAASAGFMGQPAQQMQDPRQSWYGAPR